MCQSTVLHTLLLHNTLIILTKITPCLFCHDTCAFMLCISLLLKCTPYDHGTLDCTIFVDSNDLAMFSFVYETKHITFLQKYQSCIKLLKIFQFVFKKCKVKKNFFDSIKKLRTYACRVWKIASHFSFFKISLIFLHIGLSFSCDKSGI